MKGEQKHTAAKVFLGVTVLILLTLNASAVIYFNSSDIGFDETEVESSVPLGESLRDHVVEGAGYFLESYAEFLFFMNKMEVGELVGLDYKEAHMNLNRAIEKMEQARDVYIRLKQKADITPYNSIVLDELSNFNYNLFQKKNRLLASIFSQVATYLGKGKIREMYGEVLSHTGEILNIAYTIKAKIEVNEFPEVSDLWSLSEHCSQSLLFGQYAARVFFEITEK